jgi:hypothetical protein
MEPQTPQFGKKPVDFSKAPEGLKALERMVTPAYKPATGKEAGKPGVTVGMFSSDIYNTSTSGKVYKNNVRKVPGGTARGGGISGGVIGALGGLDQIK